MFSIIYEGLALTRIRSYLSIIQAVTESDLECSIILKFKNEGSVCIALRSTILASLISCLSYLLARQ